MLTCKVRKSVTAMPTYECHMRRVEGAVAAEKQLLNAAALGAEEVPEGVVEWKVLQLDDAQRQL